MLYLVFTYLQYAFGILFREIRVGFGLRSSATTTSMFIANFMVKRPEEKAVILNIL